MNKLPPIEKIHEAYSAIADNRVVMGENAAKVVSSNGAKEYSVTWKDNVYSANDSASYWQGYAGYPMIAVLMLQGKLPLNRLIADNFKGINWTELNLKHKAKYDKAVAVIMDSLRDKGIDCAAINSEIAAVYEQIKALAVTTKRSPIKPPKAGGKEQR